MRRALWSAVLITGAATGAHAQAPGSQIYLAPLTHIGDSIAVGAPVNVTNRPGYNNQPAFLPDGRALLFTVIGSDRTADIWRYDLATHQTTRVTNTPESEYSATVMPGGRRFSVIRVERDSAQRLWSFAMDGSDPQVVLPALKPVGYHDWLDSTRLVAYVLGTPSTLHLINADGTGDAVRATNIGRSLHRLALRPGYSFTQRDSSGAYWIMADDLGRNGAVRLVRAATDNEFHAWTPDGVLLTASAGMLVRWNTQLGANGAWLPVANLARAGVRNVTRLAVSPDGRWLAFVAEPAAP